MVFYGREGWLHVRMFRNRIAGVGVGFNSTLLSFIPANLLGCTQLNITSWNCYRYVSLVTARRFIIGIECCYFALGCCYTLVMSPACGLQVICTNLPQSRRNRNRCNITIRFKQSSRILKFIEMFWEATKRRCIISYHNELIIPTERCHFCQITSSLYHRKATSIFAPMSSWYCFHPSIPTTKVGGSDWLETVNRN